MKTFKVTFVYNQVDDGFYIVKAKSKADAQRKFTRLATSIEEI